MWVIRPDGRDARRVAGVRSGTATFGPWLRTGAVLPLSTSGRRPEETSSTLLDVHTGVSRPLGYGDPFTVLDIRHDGVAALVRVGGRGRRTVLSVRPADGRVRTADRRRRRRGAARIRARSFPTAGCCVRSNLRRDRYALMLLGAGKPATGGRWSEVIAAIRGGSSTASR